MIAFWQVGTGEVLQVEVISGFEAFEKLINSHEDMRFFRWEKKK